MVPMSLFYVFFFAFLSAFLFVRTGTPEILLLGSLVIVKEIADSFSYLTMV